MPLQPAPQGREPRQGGPREVSRSHLVEGRLAQLRTRMSVRQARLDRPRAPEAGGGQGRRVAQPSRPTRGLLRRLLRQARRNRREPELQVWLVLSGARSAWQAELGRHGAPAVCLQDAGGWEQLLCHRTRDEISGWLSSRDLCGIFVGRTPSAESWLSQLLHRAFFGSVLGCSGFQSHVAASGSYRWAGGG